MELMIVLQALEPGTWAWIVGGLATAIGIVVGAYNRLQAERIKDKDKQIETLQEEVDEKDIKLDSKDEKLDDLVSWTRMSSEKTIENYAKIIGILETLSSDKGMLETSVAREMTSQLQQLRLEFSREFSELKLLLQSVKDNL